jgi:phospholipid/cholesterol/gamma-HCH transport system substrate-binding protein
MKREFKIGLFLAVTFLIAAVSVFVLGKVGRLFDQRGYALFSSFESVAGLDRRAVVRIGGVRVGFVESISLEGSRPLVRLTITRRDVAVPVDSKASLASLGMLGEKYVEILPGVSREACKPGGRIEAMASLSFDQIGGLMLSIGGEIRAVSDSLRDMMNEENRDKVEATLENLASLTGALDDFLRGEGGSLREGVQDIGMAAREARRAIEAVAGGLSASAEALRGLLEENRGLVKSNLTKAEEVLREVESAVERLSEALDKLNKGEGALGRLLGDPALGEKADRAATGAAAAADAVGSLRAGVDVRAEYYGESRLAKGSLGFDLGLGPRNLVRAGLTRDPWEDRFAYSLQVGRRFGPFAPRAGLIESELGVGLDYEAWGRRLRLSLDGFDFNRDEGPRFRASTRFFPARPVFVVLGVDDFSLASGREFYFGLGIEAR